MADILEHPDDDTPRLGYADWLEESGGGDERGRAEFIRVQVRLARMDADDPERGALRAREEAMLEEHGVLWRRGFPAGLVEGVNLFLRLGPKLRGFRRGFVADVDCWAWTLAEAL